MSTSEDNYSSDYESAYDSDFEDDEDFSNVYPEEAPPPQIQPTYNEKEFFPNLFKTLESAFIEGFMNYTDTKSDQKSALGLFIGMCNDAKEDLVAKIYHEHDCRVIELKENFEERADLIDKKGMYSNFQDQLFLLLQKASFVWEVFTQRQEKVLNVFYTELRRFILNWIGELEKQIKMGLVKIRSGDSLSLQKTEELWEQYCWKRFANKVKFSMHNRMLYADTPKDELQYIKKFIEDNIRDSVSVKQAFSIEDFEYEQIIETKSNEQYSLFTANQKMQRVTKVSELATKNTHIVNVCSKILDIESFKSITPLKKKAKPLGFPTEMMLSRWYIKAFEDPEYHAYNQYIYYLPEEANEPIIFSMLTDFQNPQDVLEAESDATPIRRAINIEEMYMYKTDAVITLNKQEYRMTPLTIAELYASVYVDMLPNVVSEQIRVKPNNLKYFYVIDKTSFYKTYNNPDWAKTTLRCLKENEISEIFQAYVYRTMGPSDISDCFPESKSADHKLKYEYAVISDRISMKSGVFQKNWLAQYTRQKRREETFDSIAEPQPTKVCKWAGCLSPVISPIEILDFKDQSRLSKAPKPATVPTKNKKGRRKPSDKKGGLVPVRKIRNATEEVNFKALCVYHNQIRNFMRRRLTGKISYPLGDNKSELWSAVQCGNRWREELAEHSKLRVITGDAGLKVISKAVAKAKRNLTKKKHFHRSFTENLDILDIPRDEITDSDSFTTYKERLLNEIDRLRKQRDYEVQTTSEIRKYLFIEIPFSSFKQRIQRIKDAFKLPEPERLEQLKQTRQLIESEAKSIYHQLSDEPSRNITQNMRIPSTRPDNHSDMKIIKNEQFHKKLYTSPYMERMPPLHGQKRRPSNKGQGQNPKRRTTGLKDIAYSNCASDDRLNISQESSRKYKKRFSKDLNDLF